MRTPVRVILCDADMQIAAHGGVNRQLKGGKHPKSPEVKYWDQHFWQSHIIGAISEYAIAKLLDLEWQWEIRQDKYDVGTYQVRATENPSNRLLVRKNDNPTDQFIFAKVHDNRVLLEGWTTGQRVIDHKDEIFKGTYVMPDYLLYPIADLPDFPQTLPAGCEMYKTPVKRLGTQL
jgi:hypothetical protein